MTTANALNEDIFTELRETMGADFIVELVGSYLLDVPEQMDALNNALKSGEPDTFRRAAHSIKSTSLYFGAEQFATQARLLEEKGKSGQIDGSEDEIAALRESFGLVQAHLKELGYE